MKGAIMGLISDFRYRKISQTSTVEDLLKEFFRKSIHICASFVPLFAAWNLSYTVMGLSGIMAVYIISEYLRISGIFIPVISRITAYAARRRDEGRFILGPVTLVFGIVITLMLFSPEAAKVGIFALAFGDGIASLAGKLFGRIKIPYTQGKTLEGSLSCFIAVYASSLAISCNPLSALVIAIVAMFIEMIPLRDYDNVVIPIAIASVASLLP